MHLNNFRIFIVQIVCAIFFSCRLYCAWGACMGVDESDIKFVIRLLSCEMLIILIWKPENLMHAHIQHNSIHLHNRRWFIPFPFEIQWIGWILVCAFFYKPTGKDATALPIWCWWNGAIRGISTDTHAGLPLNIEFCSFEAVFEIICAVNIFLLNKKNSVKNPISIEFMLDNLALMAFFGQFPQISDIDEWKPFQLFQFRSIITSFS